jgi:hypothetical protein
MVSTGYIGYDAIRRTGTQTEVAVKHRTCVPKVQGSNRGRSTEYHNLVVLFSISKLIVQVPRNRPQETTSQSLPAHHS